MRDGASTDTISNMTPILSCMEFVETCLMWISHYIYTICTDIFAIFLLHVKKYPYLITNYIIVHSQKR